MKREGRPLNRVQRKRKEQRLRAKGYEVWVPKRAKKKEQKRP